jgi:hypothetical protein
MYFGVRFKGAKNEANGIFFEKDNYLDALLEVIVLKALAMQVEFTEDECILMQEKLHDALVRARKLGNPN